MMSEDISRAVGRRVCVDVLAARLQGVPLNGADVQQEEAILDVAAGLQGEPLVGADVQDGGESTDVLTAGLQGTPLVGVEVEEEGENLDVRTTSWEAQRQRERRQSLEELAPGWEDVPVTCAQEEAQGPVSRKRRRDTPQGPPKLSRDITWSRTRLRAKTEWPIASASHMSLDKAGASPVALRKFLTHFPEHWHDRPQPRHGVLEVAAAWELPISFVYMFKHHQCATSLDAMLFLSDLEK